MPRMVSYLHRLQSGHITSYLDRTFDVLTTPREFRVDTYLISVHTPRPVAGADFAARSWSSFLIDLRFCTDSRGISNNSELWQSCDSRAARTEESSAQQREANCHGRSYLIHSHSIARAEC